MPVPKRFRNKRTYSVDFLETVNTAISETECPFYKQLYGVMVDKYNFSKPGELVILDRWCYNVIRMRRVQRWLLKNGEMRTVNAGKNAYTQVDSSVYYLNSIQTQLRADEKEMMMTPKEESKGKIGLGTQDFSAYMKEIVAIDGELVDDKKE